MGCTSCGGLTVSPKSYSGQTYKKAVIVNPDCEWTGQLLQNWYTYLKCVKISGKLQQIELTEFGANRYLGIIQSAINYPDNYCYFQPQLLQFQQTILPLIVQNVSECIG